MRRLVRVLSLVLGLVGSTAPAFADPCETSCSLECQTQVQEYQRVVDANAAYCNGAKVTCVPSCTSRDLDGTCRTWGQDYCDWNATCIPRASQRYADGSIRAYDTDFCGAGPVNCVGRCVSRGIDGTCRQYGLDACGLHASCAAQCIRRGANGDCLQYGPDQCVPS